MLFDNSLCVKLNNRITTLHKYDGYVHRAKQNSCAENSPKDTLIPQRKHSKRPVPVCTYSSEIILKKTDK